MNKVREQIEWLGEMGYSHYECERTMELMLDVVLMAKDVCNCERGSLQGIGAIVNLETP